MTEGVDNEGNELDGSGGDIIGDETDETERPDDLDKTKDEPVTNDAEEDAADADSEVGSNGGDSGVATADESQDVKAVKDDKAGSDQNDGVTDEVSDNADRGGESKSAESEQIIPEPQVVEEVDKVASEDDEAVPAGSRDSEEGNDDVVTTEAVEEEDISSEANKDDDPNQGEEPPNETPQNLAEESTISENQDETGDPGEEALRETDPADSANATNETSEELPAAESGEAADVNTVDDDPPAESAEEPNGDAEVVANDEPLASNADDTQPEETATDEANPEEPQKIEPMLTIGSVYIIDDDGTLSAAPGTLSINDEGDLQERDSEQTIATNPSDVGMMVWPEIKPEKEETEAEPIMEKEVTSEEGIEVLTEVDIQPTQEEIKMLPDKSEDAVTETTGNEENIFAPQIDSLTDLLEAESAPMDEFNPEELADAEGSSEDRNLDESSSKGMTEQAGSPKGSVATAGTATQQTTEQPGTGEDLTSAKSELKSKKEADIESLVKKDSEMMLLPTPATSDIMLYLDNECEKCTQKVSPTQQLSNKLSLVDVQVAVPVDETVVEVVERHRYPKWMNIPGIGPIVPDHIIEEAEKYFLKVSELQEGMVMPRNIKHFHCPPLEMNPEWSEDEKESPAN